MINATNSPNSRPYGSIMGAEAKLIGYGEDEVYYGLGGSNSNPQTQAFDIGDILGDTLGGAATGGPAGAGIGAIFGIITNLFGDIFSEGWSLSCIGKQAFDKNNFKKEMDEAKVIVDAVNPNSLSSVQNVLNQMSWRYRYNEETIPHLRSSCSKTLMQKFVDYCKGVITQMTSKLEYTTTPRSDPHHDNGSYSWNTYNVLGLKSSGTTPDGGDSSGGNPPLNPTGGINPYFPPNPNTTGSGSSSNVGSNYNPDNYYDESQGLQNAFSQLPQSEQMLLATYATSNNVNFLELLKGYFSGSVVIRDGKVFWSASGGNKPESSLMDFLIIGGIGYAVFKFIRK